MLAGAVQDSSRQGRDIIYWYSIRRTPTWRRLPIVVEVWGPGGGRAKAKATLPSATETGFREDATGRDVGVCPLIAAPSGECCIDELADDEGLSLLQGPRVMFRLPGIRPYSRHSPISGNPRVRGWCSTNTMLPTTSTSTSSTQSRSTAPSLLSAPSTT